MRVDNWTDTSGSRCSTYSLQKGIELGLAGLPRICRPVVDQRVTRASLKRRKSTTGGRWTIYSACQGFVGCNPNYAEYIDYPKKGNAQWKSRGGIYGQPAIVEKPGAKKDGKVKTAAES